MIYGTWVVINNEGKKLPAFWEDIREFEKYECKADLQGLWYKSIQVVGNFGNPMVQLTGYPHCCGTLILSGVHETLSAKERYNILKGALKLARKFGYSNAEYLTAPYQTKILSTLKRLGFVSGTSYVNQRSGSTVTQWTINPQTID